MADNARLQRITLMTRHSRTLTALALALALRHSATVFGETAYLTLCRAVNVTLSAETRYIGCGAQPATHIYHQTFYLERDGYTIHPIVAACQWSNGFSQLWKSSL